MARSRRLALCQGTTHVESYAQSFVFPAPAGEKDTDQRSVVLAESLFRADLLIYFELVSDPTGRLATVP